MADYLGYLLLIVLGSPIVFALVVFAVHIMCLIVDSKPVRWLCELDDPHRPNWPRTHR